MAARNMVLDCFSSITNGAVIRRGMDELLLLDESECVGGLMNARRENQWQSNDQRPVLCLFVSN